MIKSNSTQLIANVAKSLGYKTTYLSTGRPKRLMVTSKDKMCIINSSLFGFYPETQRWQQHLFDSKALTQEVLKKVGYKTIPTKVLEPKQFSTYKAFRENFESRIKKLPIIIKPSKGLKGNDIFLANTKSELRKTAQSIYRLQTTHLAQPVLPYDEYRILIVNNTVEVMHMKQLHCVYGNGTSTLEQLLATKQSREVNLPFIKREMKKRKLNMRSILKKNEKFPYHLTRFSSPGDYYETKKISQAVQKWAKTLSKKLSTPTIGIDVFAPKGVDCPDAFIIIELNANPAFDYFKYRYNDEKTVTAIIRKTLQNYFK